VLECEGERGKRGKRKVMGDKREGGSKWSEASECVCVCVCVCVNVCIHSIYIYIYMYIYIYVYL
jgi:hypothetical protein